MLSHIHSWLKLKICVLSLHLHSHPWAHLLESLLLFYFDLSFPVFFSCHLLHCELYTELDNLIVMESLCYSANKESKDAHDVSTSFAGFEPNFMTFGEINDSSGSFSYIIPSSDQDMDDVTLGKLLTEAHRGQADYCEPEGVSVSQSSSSVVFDGSGKPKGERNVDQSLFLVSQETRTVLIASFLKTPELRKWSIDQGNLRSEIAQMHRLGLYLKNRDRWLSRNIAKKWVITNSMQLMQKKSVDSFKDIYGAKNGTSWSSSTSSYRNGRITEIPELYLRYDGETKAPRGPEHYFEIIRQSSRTTKRSKLYERF